MTFLLACFDYIVYQLLQNGYTYKIYVEKTSISDAINCAFNTQFTSILLFLLFLLLRYKKPEKIELKKYECFIAVLFSAFLLISESFNKTNSLVLINSNFSCFLLFVAMLIMLSNLIICLLKWLKFFLIKILENKKIVNFIKQNKKIEFFEKSIFLFSFLIIFIFWLPYIIARYPLVTEWDAFRQILQGLGFQKLNNNWPIASTMFFGSVIQLGYKIFGNYNDAGFLLVLLQSAICALCLAYSIKIISKLAISRTIKIFMLLIYALAPIYAKYTTAIVKDSMFACFVVLFVSTIVDIFVIKNYKLANYILFFIFSFIMCILRNNGIFLILFLMLSILPVAFKEKKNWNIIIACILIMVSYKFYGFVLEKNGVGKGSIAEALSIPFQQTARYIVEHEIEVRLEEKEVIEKVLDYDKIKKEYNPKLSDYVKGTYKGDKSKLKQYFKVWLIYFFRHPDTYFSATFNNTYEFFLPGAKEEDNGLYKITNNFSKTKIFDESLRNDEAIEWLSQYIYVLENVPVINIFCNTGLIFWIIIYMFMNAIVEKKKELLVTLVPSIIGMLVCIAAPTFTWNGIRYALPVIYTFPITICIYMHGIDKSYFQCHTTSIQKERK